VSAVATTPPPPPLNKTRRGDWASLGAHAVLALWALITIVPIFWVFSSSVKTPEAIFEMPPKWIFFKPTLDNFEGVLGLKVSSELENVDTAENTGVKSQFPRYLMNTVIIAVGTTILSLLIGVPASYALARHKFRGMQLVLMGLILTRLVPPITIVIPVYVLLRNVHLLDTYTGMILVYLAFNLPFTIWIMRGFFLDLPAELEEASLVDGSSRYGAFWRIALPLSAPGLATTAIFSIIFAWNEFLFASILTTNHARTITPTISNFITDKAILWGRLYAAAAIVLLPVMIFAMLVQKHFGRGVTSGAVKG
jgi:multiple sugar transport system permease protein